MGKPAPGWSMPRGRPQRSGNAFSEVTRGNDYSKRPNAEERISGADAGNKNQPPKRAIARVIYRDHAHLLDELVPPRMNICQRQSAGNVCFGQVVNSYQKRTARETYLTGTSINVMVLLLILQRTPVRRIPHETLQAATEKPGKPGSPEKRPAQVNAASIYVVRRYSCIP